MAAKLGIPGELAWRLQQAAWLAVKRRPRTTAGTTNNPCDLVDTGE